MKIPRLIDSPALHLAMMRTASLLVPSLLRAEWLAEWHAELWSVWQSDEERNVTAYCMGAFRDALWLRHNGPLGSRAHIIFHLDVPACPVMFEHFPHPPYGLVHVESPGQCLAFLGVLGTLSILLSLVLPIPFFHDIFKGYFLAGILLLGAALMARLRPWTFLAARIFLLLPILVFGTLDLVAIGGPVLLRLTIPWGWFLAIRWLVQDQRRRCPVCSRLLSNPVRIGGSSRILLEWHGTELVCLQGHGVLHVPERPAIWFSRRRWVTLDSTWRGLFSRV
jgi:hypothetical protein